MGNMNNGLNGGDESRWIGFILSGLGAFPPSTPRPYPETSKPPTTTTARGFVVPSLEQPMSDESSQDLLTVMLDLETADVTEEVMSRALAEMTSSGWTPKNSTEAWGQAIEAGEIRYNAWSQPTLSTSGRALAIAIREERALGLFKARRLHDHLHPTRSS
jgi:hypothetical protein